MNSLSKGSVLALSLVFSAASYSGPLIYDPLTKSFAPPKPKQLSFEEAKSAFKELDSKTWSISGSFIRLVEPTDDLLSTTAVFQKNASKQRCSYNDNYIEKDNETLICFESFTMEGTTVECSTADALPSLFANKDTNAFLMKFELNRLLGQVIEHQSDEQIWPIITHAYWTSMDDIDSSPLVIERSYKNLSSSLKEEKSISLPALSTAKPCNIEHLPK